MRNTITLAANETATITEKEASLSGATTKSPWANTLT